MVCGCFRYSAEHVADRANDSRVRVDGSFRAGTKQRERGSDDLDRPARGVKFERRGAAGWLAD